MPNISNFASVKLPAQLVNQAKEVAQPLRRSAAGQIEYWATLGRVVEHSGLTVREACTAIEAYESSARTALEVSPTLKQLLPIRRPIRSKQSSDACWLRTLTAACKLTFAASSQITAKKLNSGKPLERRQTNFFTYLQVQT